MEKMLFKSDMGNLYDQKQTTKLNIRVSELPEKVCQKVNQKSINKEHGQRPERSEGKLEKKENNIF